ncbi:MAG: ATP-binding cassette domain-containing protein [Mariprofundaceae bacterium]
MHEMVVSAYGLHKHFGNREVVCGVDFEIPAGICFGILGPNGAGKTTLMRMLLGISPISKGDYRLFGHPVDDRSLRARVGVVPQMDNLDPDFTVRENLTVFASYFGIAASDVGMRIDDLLDFAALNGRTNDTVASLSGGMRRRLMIARALINEPDLIVLDEPTTGLDPQARHLIWQRLRSLKMRGKTLVLTTHYMEEAQELCDEIMILDNGQVLDRGTPDELIGRHVEAEVVALRGLLSGADVDVLCDGLDVRREHVGDTWFCYMRDARPLLARCADAAELSFIHRPASLEDVFLTLTGRELREDA